MKKIVIINGHPDRESFNHALQNAYKTGALAAGNEVEEITLSDMDFSPNLRFGYRKRTDLEPDLLSAWEKIQQANHLVLIFPIWWANMPALMKGFYDRLFLPGLTFNYREKSPFPEKLLKGRTSEIIVTMDTPYVWYYKLFFGITSQKHVLNFSGIKNKRTTYLANMRKSNEKQRQKWLLKIKKLGEKV